MLEIRRESFPEIERDGYLLEQPEAVLDWFCSALSSLSERYSIKAISVATHGATVVCIDAKGAITVPPLSYTNSADAQFADEFYNLFGQRDQLQRTTATAEVGDLINSGKMLHFLKQRFPHEMDRTRWVLVLCQYLELGLLEIG